MSNIGENIHRLEGIELQGGLQGGLQIRKKKTGNDEGKIVNI